MYVFPVSLLIEGLQSGLLLLSHAGLPYKKIHDPVK